MENQAANIGKNLGMQGANAFVNSQKKDPYKKRRLFYALGAIALQAALGLSAWIVWKSPGNLLILMQLFFVVLGLVHFMVLPNFLYRTEEGNFLKYLIYTGIITLLGALAFSIVFYVCKGQDYLFPFCFVNMGLLLPLFVSRTFELALRVPSKLYKTWSYPSKPPAIDMDRVDTSQFAIVTFVFSKKHNEESRSNFQSKAPFELKLGDLFYFFIQEWNYKNAQSTIEYMLEDQSTAYEWQFYVKPNWYSPRRYLDPEKTVKEVLTKSSQIVITERVIPETSKS